MANGFLVLTKEDWKAMDQDQKEWATFNTLQSMNERLQVLERKSFFNRVCVSIGAVFGGAAGGIAAVLGLK
jgi:hypothetical protein